MADIALDLAGARELAMTCLLANGCDESNAAPVADSMIAAERDICLSHGLFRLPSYVQGLRSGRINGKARPRLENLSEAVLRVDADRSMAPVAHAVGLDALAEGARTTGVAALAITNTCHFSALWVEIEALTDRGVCAFACTSYLPVVAPAGGREPLFGTNPIAFGWPRPGGSAMIFDQATAAMARGEIMIAQREGHALPEGVGVDAEGRPTTDPEAILAGAQLAFGGYKGAALALMVDLLAGPLLGESLSIETAERYDAAGGPPLGGEFILAIAPERFAPGFDYEAHAARLFDRIEAMDGARLPSARRYRNRRTTAREGIGVKESLHAEILRLSSP